MTRIDFAVTAVRPRFIAIPLHLARREFDAAESGVGFVAPAERIEMSAREHGARPVDFELRAGPDFVERFSVRLIKQFDPGIETMEGAALHYVCLQENIPFIQIRSVSNHVGERDKTKWKMKEAINNLNTELSKLINRLTD